MKKAIFTLFAVTILLATANIARATSRLVTGTVSDSVNGRTLPGVLVRLKNTKVYASTDAHGAFRLNVPAGSQILAISARGYRDKEILLGASQSVLHVQLNRDVSLLDQQVFRKLKTYRDSVSANSKLVADNNLYTLAEVRLEQTVQGRGTTALSAPKISATDNENYSTISENRFLSALSNPLSTFGIDVDGASYSNIRRFINRGSLPPADAVRIEEMINYFNYSYPQPKQKQAFSMNTEISTAPWNTDHRLVKIGIQGLKEDIDDLPASNLVFLIDVSGSMQSPDKLPLLKSSLKMLSEQLRERDKVSIVVYAGAAGCVLPVTSGNDKAKIREAIDRLSAGGSTAGGAGIKLAYEIARKHFVKGGNNRVILATDGDFNVGVSSDAEMQHLIEQERESGVFLSVLGFGTGNYQDSKMELLADKGNGNYAYIDNISEARKVLIKEFGGTLFTIAKDVKLQVEFNPDKVKAYRLIGYENRLLHKEDFNNDKKDAGDLGAGHTVTALYEVIPVGVQSVFTDSVDQLKYQVGPKVSGHKSAELLTVKLRYKKPDENNSHLLEYPVVDQNISFLRTSEDFHFAASVAAFGMLLKDSEFKQGSSFDKIIEWAKPALGEDEEGYRREFISLVKSAKLLSFSNTNSAVTAEEDTK